MNRAPIRRKRSFRTPIRDAGLRERGWRGVTRQRAAQYQVPGHDAAGRNQRLQLFDESDLDYIRAGAR